MIARSISAVTGGGRYALDAPVAALAGLSVAFLAFAAPADLLEELIRAGGLSALLPDAEPVGVKARIGVGAAGAVMVFAVAFLLLRWLDRFGARPIDGPAPMAVERDVLEVPRLRRRDFHPDAPPRPPLMATFELGEPEPTAEALETADTALEPAPSPVEPDPLPIEHAASPQPALKASPPMPARSEPPAASAAQAEPQDGSLSELMARLEQGLARRRTPPPVPRAAEPAPPAAGTADDRLQSAIASLQRLAAHDD